MYITICKLHVSLRSCTSGGQNSILNATTQYINDKHQKQFLKKGTIFLYYHKKFEKKKKLNQWAPPSFYAPHGQSSVRNWLQPSTWTLVESRWWRSTEHQSTIEVHSQHRALSEESWHSNNTQMAGSQSKRCESHPESVSNWGRGNLDCFQNRKAGFGSASWQGWSWVV